jgi:hypothetical protein
MMMMMMMMMIIIMMIITITTTTTTTTTIIIIIIITMNTEVCRDIFIKYVPEQFMLLSRRHAPEDGGSMDSET